MANIVFSNRIFFLIFFPVCFSPVPTTVVAAVDVSRVRFFLYREWKTFVASAAASGVAAALWENRTIQNIHLTHFLRYYRVFPAHAVNGNRIRASGAAAARLTRRQFGTRETMPCTRTRATVVRVTKSIRSICSISNLGNEHGFDGNRWVCIHRGIGKFTPPHQK